MLEKARNIFSPRVDLLLDMSIIELYNEVACYLAILRWIPAKRTDLNDYDKVGFEEALIAELLVDAAAADADAPEE